VALAGKDSGDLPSEGLGEIQCCWGGPRAVDTWNPEATSLGGGHRPKSHLKLKKVGGLCAGHQLPLATGCMYLPTVPGTTPGTQWGLLEVTGP
jgi:hypothetical protein